MATVTELSIAFLRLRKGHEEEGIIYARIKDDHTALLRFQWKDDNARGCVSSREVGTARFNARGDIIKLEPNKSGPFELVDTLLQAYREITPQEG